MPDPVYDGCQQLKGVWGGNPDSVPNNYAHQASNRFFREDYNNARPSISEISLTFDSEENRIWFQGANGQGSVFYNPWPSGAPKLVTSIGGRIFSIEIRGKKGIVTQIYDGNSRQFMHAWFAQGFQWLAIQDGIHPPLFWDGTNPPRRSDIVQNEMPIGSVMAFIHGRFVVASSDGKNSIYVGDIAYGDTITTPDDILKFTEQTYWAEGGSFNTPVFLGDIQGLYPMPFLDTGDGQYELVVACDQGFTSLNISGPRPTWIDTQVQRVSLIGSGLVSSHGFCGLNGDMFFRTQAGISSYRNTRVSYSQSWTQTPLSREVNYWIKPDRTDLLQFIPQVSWQNMVLTGCSPMTAPPNNPGFGYHRFCRGMVVFDADSKSTAGRDGTPVWHGQWSGVRPWAFAQGVIQNANRCFVFSFDRDGRNRLYELGLTQGDDVFGTTPRKIQSYYTTGMFGNVEARTSAFAPKIINGGMIEFSGVLSDASFRIEYRPDGSPCYVFVDSANPGCECPERVGDCPPMTSMPQYGRKYFPQVPDNKCVPGSNQPANVFHHCQVRVNALGSFTVDRLNIRMELRTDSQIAECLPQNCKPIDCCPNADDYAYHIAPAGENTEVPDIPGSGTTRYVATRAVRLCCPDRITCVTEYGQGESVVSQSDADQKAQAAAQANAETALSCLNCNTQTLADQFIDGGDIDYSAYFVTGEQGSSINQPWRLQDVITDQTIASGIINTDGTMETFQTFTYSHGSFNPMTNVYTDTGGGATRISLEIGCAVGGTQTWPPVGGYGQ